MPDPTPPHTPPSMGSEGAPQTARPLPGAPDVTAAPPPTAPLHPPTTPPTSPHRTGRLALWLVLIALVAMACPPMLIALRQTPIVNPHEAQRIAVTTETWQRQAQLTDAAWTIDLLIPVHHGQAQLAAPPGTTWMGLLMLRTLDPATASSRQITHRLRLVSVLGALGVVIGVFWAGYAIGGFLTAATAGLVMASAPALAWYGRMATPDTLATACLTLAVAAALWAMRPHRRAPSLTRQATGFGFAGLALGGAILTTGPAAVPLVVLPLGLTALLGKDRIAHSICLLAIGAIALLVVAPWALIVHGQNPDVWLAWGTRMMPHARFDPTGYLSTAGHRLLLGLIVTLPWTLWVLGGIVQPFSTSSTGVRSRMFIGWAWLASCLGVFLTMPGDRSTRVLLPVVAAAALVVGQLFRQLADLSAEGRHARIWRLGRGPMIFMTFAVSILAVLGLGLQEPMIARGWLDARLTLPMHAGYDVAVGLALLAAAGLGARFALGHYPGKALTAWAVWTVLLTSALAMPLARGPLLPTSRPPEATPHTTKSLSHGPEPFPDTDTDTNTGTCPETIGRHPHA